MNYDKMDRVQIVLALQIIKGVCEDANRNCEECPLRHKSESGHTVCYLRTHNPHTYNINKDEPWKALK